MEELKIIFPKNEEYTFETGKPIVLLGANGAGKTRFGIRIEELNDPSFSRGNVQIEVPVHRISAQKSLSIGEKISILDNDSSHNNLFKGNSKENATKLAYRFKMNPATFLLDDYNEVLSLLFSEEHKELQLAHKIDKQAIEENTERPQPISTVVERAMEIWNELIPHRKIDLTGQGVHVNYNGQIYHGKEMSDGERVILYMICQVLVQRPKTLLIIDEPELHIHKSIVGKLWTRLEEERRDCLFMYITHDLNFALSRDSMELLWIKSYDGREWEYEFLDYNDYEDIPDDLLFEIIGTRQKILFVEGTKDSYDYQLYQEIYKDKGYHVIPCGGCQEVIRFVKSKNAYEKLNSIQVYGIVDRDFRTEHEISALQKDGIYCIDVAEVENLFVVPELLDIMEKVLFCEAGTAEKGKKFIKELFEANKYNQINLALLQEMKYQLSLFKLDKRKLTSKDIKEKIDIEYSEQRIEELLITKQKIFNEADTLEKILEIFNFKDISKKISKKFDLSKDNYPRKVINSLRSKHIEREKILEVLRKYTPDLP
ncbi:DUF4435 domain-containing protein [Peptacetobacter hominis]|uniref:DUF4435 domain-containing protein n=1 Tax=Peptacetobacter hominis TaxID=2743610 RepID=A0A544QU14_9FIRM|nr:DUF4435 domain-containing protein [Peptacetobacter hominis]TQQ84191.1 DUF4435 domain-containing protein [Peptacetobacter hominis]